MTLNCVIMLQKQPKIFVEWKVKMQFITVYCPDGSRNFTWVARISMIRYGQAGLKLDSDAKLQVKETNPASSTWGVSGEIGISQSSVIHHFHNFGKSIKSCQNCASRHENIAKLLTQSCIFNLLISKLFICSFILRSKVSQMSRVPLQF